MAEGGGRLGSVFFSIRHPPSVIQCCELSHSIRFFFFPSFDRSVDVDLRFFFQRFPRRGGLLRRKNILRKEDRKSVV